MTDNANKLGEESILASTNAPATGTVSANAASATVNTLKRIRLHIDAGINELRASAIEKAIESGEIHNPKLDGVHLIFAEKKDHERDFMQSLNGLATAYELLMKDPQAKIIIGSFTFFGNVLKKLAEKAGKKEILTVLQASPNVRFIELPMSIEDFNRFSFRNQVPLKTLTMHFDTENNDARQQRLALALAERKMTNTELEGVHVIQAEMPDKQFAHHKIRYPDAGLRKAYDLVKSNPDAKIIIVSALGNEYLSSHQMTKELFTALNANPNVIFFDLKTLDNFSQALEKFNKLSFEKQQTSNTQITDSELIDALHHISREHLNIIRHSLQPNKVKDPYHPADDREQRYVNEAFELTKKYFPGLDTVTKMLDYVMHIPLDIPEPMKGQRIEGVYVDVDGTLIEYVPIGSDKEGKQELRPEVVELLKKYEQEGKKIVIWTGGDVEKKEKRLRELGITWPVVSKYDYAGATAEIVVDDTDKAAFMLQSKILPETYIDTTKLTA